MNQAQRIRDSVSLAYSRALCAEGPASCCGPVPKGTLARRAGYAAEELAAIPSEAVTHSFGCGNPLAFSDVRPGDVVLDLGCGAGIDLALAARMVGREGRVIGVDMTDSMIAKARAVIAEAGLSNVEVRKGLIENLPVETASVDWVISNCVINLSPEKPRVFAEIARVLKPGGRVLVSDIIAEDLPVAARESLVLYSCCVAGALSEREYRSGLEHAGLSDVAIRKVSEFDVGQLEALVESDRRAFDPQPDVPPGGVVTLSSGAGLAATCAGKVWSAEIRARKS